MSEKNLGKTARKARHDTNPKEMQGGRTYPRPRWVPKNVVEEDELCPDCFKVVGVKSRYTLVRLLGKAPHGLSVGALTRLLSLRQPTVTHHLQVLQSVDAVAATQKGRERIYRLNRNAHCFEECKIPYR